MRIQERIQKHKAKLTSTDWMIYDYLDKNQKELPEWTMERIAQDLHISTTTLFRFCSKLEISGFSELKAIIKNESQAILTQEDISLNYHQVVDYIYEYDTQELFFRMNNSKKIYIYADGEVELRVAKEIQRIFQQSNFQIYLLPNELALTSSLKQLTDELLWIIKLSDDGQFPLALYTNHEDIYKILLAPAQKVNVVFDELLFIPNVYRKEFKMITPYILACEILYLKLHLA